MKLAEVTADTLLPANVFSHQLGKAAALAAEELETAIFKVDVFAGHNGKVWLTLAVRKGLDLSDRTKSIFKKHVLAVKLPAYDDSERENTGAWIEYAFLFDRAGTSPFLPEWFKKGWYSFDPKLPITITLPDDHSFSNTASPT